MWLMLDVKWERVTWKAPMLTFVYFCACVQTETPEHLEAYDPCP